MQKRKEQGIYYTPKEVVNYIIKEVVLDKIKGTKIESIHILDPACGSGSFIIKIIDYLFI